MSIPDENKVAASARTLVMRAKSSNTLDQLSKSKVRQALEAELGLDEGALKKFKNVISQAVDETIQAETDDEAEATSPPNAGKRRRGRSAKGDADLNPPKRKEINEPKTVEKPRHRLPSTEDENIDDNQAQKVESEYSEVIDESPPSPKKTESTKAKPKKEEKPRKPKTQGNRVPSKPHESESELSEVIDEPPPKRSKKSDGSKERTKKSKEPVSRNDGTIKKYKALVLACGMRKQWKKEFAECPTEAAQINRLKSILTSLGMKGRMSMEQAKAIREKRELKAELDDVIRFERSKGVNAQQSGSSQAGDDDESDSEGNMTKPSASRSIMAFLADQSDSD